VKCSVRSMFSCCFAFAMSLDTPEKLCGNSARSSCAVATRLDRVYLRLRYYWTATSAAANDSTLYLF
jgi:hypothetical protein